MARLVRVVALSLFVLVLTTAEMASAQHGLSAVDGPVRVTLSANENGTATARFSVVIRNDSRFSGRLRGTFVRDTGRRRPVTRNQDAPASGVRVILIRPGRLTIGPNRVRGFRFELRVARMPATEVAGVMVLAAGDGSVAPAAVPLAASAGQAASRWRNARFEPAKVTIKVVRGRPDILGWDDDEDVTLAGVGPGEVLRDNQLLDSAVASGDEGGRAGVELLAKGDRDAAGQVAALAKVADVTRSGSYSADLSPDPDAEGTPKLAFTVVARDWWPYPLFAVIGGALFAWFGLKRYAGRDRVKKVLRQDLAEVADHYEWARRGVGDTCPYDLGPVIGDSSTWSSCRPGEADPEAHHLWWEIGQAETREDLDALIQRVRDLDARVKLWPEACRRARELGDALRELDRIWEAERIDDLDDLLERRNRNGIAPIAQRAKELLHLDRPPADAAAAAGHVTELTRQTTAVRLWHATHRTFEEIQGEFDRLAGRQGLPEDARLQLAAHNPHVIRRVYLEPAKGLDDLLGERVHGRMLEAAALTLSLGQLYPERALKVKQDVQPDRELLGGPLPAAPEDRVETTEVPLSRRLLADLRTRDLLDFAIGFLVAAIIYLATAYAADDTFGSLWDYVAAFAAGAGGQLVVSWQLLPWFRSYRAQAATPAG